MRWLCIGMGVGVACLALWGCATALLPGIPLDAQDPAAPPPILGAYGDDAAVATSADWRERRAALVRGDLRSAVYGPSPELAPTRVIAHVDIAYAPLANIARVEQWTVAVTEGDDPLRYNLVLVTPRRAQTAPLIIMQNFCGNRAAFRGRPEAIAPPRTPVLWLCEHGWADLPIEAVFGRHINAPPFDEALARGYALALFYAGDVVGDTEESARAGLARLYGEDAEEAGALAVWAKLYSSAVDALARDPRIDVSRIAVWGHSRNGKAALLAAADDPRIAAVIAHQSGRGGASLNHSNAGESLDRIMETYGYWFTPAFARASETDPALDQHQLLALIAPRPVLLGNARRDAWADPAGAFRAAQSADPVYELLGAQGLAQQRMNERNLGADLVFYMRDGLHGVTSEDWGVFLDFLDLQLKPPAPAAALSARVAP